MYCIGGQSAWLTLFLGESNLNRLVIKVKLDMKTKLLHFLRGHETPVHSHVKKKNIISETCSSETKHLVLLLSENLCKDIIGAANSFKHSVPIYSGYNLVGETTAANKVCF